MGYKHFKAPKFHDNPTVTGRLSAKTRAKLAGQTAGSQSVSDQGKQIFKKGNKKRGAGSRRCDNANQYWSKSHGRCKNRRKATMTSFKPLQTGSRALVNMASVKVTVCSLSKMNKI